VVYILAIPLHAVFYLRRYLRSLAFPVSGVCTPHSGTPPFAQTPEPFTAISRPPSLVLSSTKADYLSRCPIWRSDGSLGLSREVRCRVEVSLGGMLQRVAETQGCAGHHGTVVLSR
jgi:hypothetical protein